MDVLREARLEAGLTQQQVAKKMKRGKNFVSVLETGERSIEICEFIDYAKVLKVEADELIRRLLR